MRSDRQAQNSSHLNKGIFFHLTDYSILEEAQNTKQNSVSAVPYRGIRNLPTDGFRKKCFILILFLQVTETQDLVPAVEALLQYPFPTTEGPLWCARLLPVGAPSRCSRPDLAAEFPYSRTLLLANHHGIADGTTNLFVTNAFLRILDDVVANKHVDDEAQLGRLVAGEETKALLTAKMQELMKDEGHFQKLLKEEEETKREKKLIPCAYPMPNNPDFKSQIILRDLDKETTQSFIRKCKKEGVSVNSGLAAVFEVGLVDFVQDGGLKQDFYRIHEVHSVNLRRYWSCDTSGTLGVHMMTFANVVSTPAKWRDNFWDYARSIHKNLGQALKNKDPLMHVMSMMFGKKAENFFLERPPPECDYGVGNMGNIDISIPTEGQQIRLTNLVRATSCWNDPMYYMCHTLRGCFMYSLTFCNDILTQKNAEKLVDKTFDNLISVIQM